MHPGANTDRESALRVPALRPPAARMGAVVFSDHVGVRDLCVRQVYGLAAAWPGEPSVKTSAPPAAGEVVVPSVIVVTFVPSGYDPALARTLGLSESLGRLVYQFEGAGRLLGQTATPMLTVNLIVPRSMLSTEHCSTSRRWPRSCRSCGTAPRTPAEV